MIFRLTIVSVFISLSLIFSSLPLYASQAPEGVNEVLEKLGELEESFEKEEWQEAQEAVGNIEREVKEILANAKLQDEPLLDSLATLKKYVLANNEGQVEVQYIRFQKHFFELINHFDFDVHPVIIMIQKYVMDESTEAYEKKDYEDVISEMREAGNLIDHAKPLFMEKGIPEQELDSFKSSVIALIMAGKKEKYVEMGSMLAKIKEQYMSFLTRYNES